MSRKFIGHALMLAVFAFSGTAAAQSVGQAHDIVVSDAWVRATVPQQRATGVFMRVTSGKDARLVGASSPVAAITEVHEMVRENDVMRMRQVKAVDLPAAKVVGFEPGSYHIMLIDLKQQIKEGDMVPVTLEIDVGGGHKSVVLEARARPLNARAQPADAHGAKTQGASGAHGAH
ncbi:copper chaperone PCu(A)C [Schauerella aestuarii]|uniref:copper chaperone PCu(A)C n=1 Tax=Schauerella aestuarii TaxID=2511204 RepID=UPI001369B42B|nr:copper chaperone PCu(A)C [Achromobacter aestuarii]MYZ43933.1 copper chaperone PCu(A)C [Achromobacter aestuarii]